MSQRTYTVGGWKFGRFCGEKFLSLKSWRRYPLFERVKTDHTDGFSIGIYLFWKG